MQEGGIHVASEISDGLELKVCLCLFVCHKVLSARDVRAREPCGMVCVVCVVCVFVCVVRCVCVRMCGVSCTYVARRVCGAYQGKHSCLDAHERVARQRV